MTPVAVLRRHVDSAHHQGDAAYQGADWVLVAWHAWEHQPWFGYGTHLEHAHDEVSARRYGVTLDDSLVLPVCDSRRATESRQT